MRLLSWNIGAFTPGLNSRAKRDEAWRLLREIDPAPDVALLQEASYPQVSDSDRITGERETVRARLWAPLIRLHDAATLTDVPQHGWVASARIRSSAGDMYLISLHGRTQGSAVVHIEALLQRLRQQMMGSFILAGDFNSCRGADSVWPGYRHLEFFESAAARYGMVNCFWEEHGREQRTFWKGCKDVGEPFQDDHFFISTDLVERHQRCEVLDYEPVRGISDHAPLLLELDLHQT